MDRKHRPTRTHHASHHRRGRLEQRPEDRKDVYARITDEIVAAIEAGPGRWTLPWHHDGSDVARPMNLASKKRYRGVNTLALWVAAMKSGYASGVWGTYRQFAEAGGQVRKGERSTTVVFWKQFRKEEADAPGDDANDGDAADHRARFMARGYAVFNAAQVDGLDLPKPPELSESERVDAADAFIGNLGIPIRTQGDQACYVPSLDEVRMPPFGRFRSADAFYSTTFHELAHATSHPARLDRKLGLRFGSRAYAAEEVIADICSGFLMADLGFAHGARAENAAYVASWLEVLKADSRAIFTAAAKAQAAADWMHQRQPGSANGEFTNDHVDAPAFDPQHEPAHVDAVAA
jgi:antirestriction protein ArdC